MASSIDVFMESGFVSRIVFIQKFGRADFFPLEFLNCIEYRLFVENLLLEQVSL